jgi:hypothetical protein
MEARQVLESSGLGEGSKIILSSYWHSPGTALRSDVRASVTPVLSWDPGESATLDAELTVPGAEIGQRLVIGMSLALGHPGQRPDPLAARLPGSMLWRDTRTFLIEGIAPRFPVEVTSFPADEDRAAWYLSIDPNFQQPLLGGVRLYLNRAHGPLMEALNAKQPGPGHRAIISALYFDVGRQMIIAALKNHEFLEMLREPRSGPPYDEESTGRALWSLISMIANGRNAGDLARLLDASPAEFERLLQHCLGLFELGSE